MAGVRAVAIDIRAPAFESEVIISAEAADTRLRVLSSVPSRSKITVFLVVCMKIHPFLKLWQNPVGKQFDSCRFLKIILFFDYIVLQY